MKQLHELSESGRLYRSRRERGLCCQCGKPQNRVRKKKRLCLDCTKTARGYEITRFNKDKPARLAACKTRNDASKAAIYARLGGYKCTCCGEIEEVFLTIEHLNGNGAKERRYYGANGRFYRALLKRENLSGYTILCMNCNRGKYLNGGICPHQISLEHNGVR